MRVPRYRGLLGGASEECVHGAEAADLRARRVNGEHEDEDDGEEDCGVRAAPMSECLGACKTCITNYLLVAEQRCSHATDHNIDGDADGDQETCLHRWTVVPTFHRRGPVEQDLLPACSFLSVK